MHHRLVSNLIFRITIAVILFCSVIIAQEQMLPLRNFGGLNTITGDFSIKPNEARKAYNVDYSRKLFSISKRWGYDRASALTVSPSADSIVAIYGAYYSDGTQQLFVVDAISGDSGYGAVYVTALGSNDLTSMTRIWDKWSIQNIPKFAMYGDNVYIVNGSHRPVVYNGEIARFLPLNAPGEPTITPLTTSGNLTGEYYYMFKATAHGTVAGIQDSVDFNASPLSLPVNVKGGKILISDFQWIPTDTFLTVIDTLDIYIYRTKANPRFIDESDSVWLVDSITALNATALADSSYTDNVADGSLGSTGFLIKDFDFYGLDSNNAFTRQYGAPSYLSKDTCDECGLGIWNGWIDTTSSAFYGFSYIVTFVDTVTGIESRPSPAMSIIVGNSMTGDTAKSYRIGLPSIPSGDSGIIYNLYRAPMFEIKHDSAFLEEYEFETPENCTWSPDNCERSGWDDSYRKGGVLYCKLCEGGRTEIKTRWSNRIVVDSVRLGAYRLVRQILSDSSAVTDSITQKEISDIGKNTNPLYNQIALPGALSNIFPFQGRMYGTYKSQLLWSEVNDPFTWGGLNNVNIGKDDGDVIILAYPTRTAIRIFKNKSNYNVFPGIDAVDYSDWSAVEISGYYGCIAPNSYAVGLGGHYYLSEQGVIRETEGTYLERTYNRELISAPLDNFTKLSMATKSDAYGFYFDQKYMLQIGDTTYVFDERANAWSTWGLSFLGATYYGVETDLNFLPGDTMYFIKPNDTGLYRYGTQELDTTANLPIVWRSAPILIGESDKQITDIGLWRRKTNVNVYVDIFDENDTGNVVNNVTFGTPQKRYRVKSALTNIGKYFFIELQGNWDSVYVDGIDIYYNDLGKTEKE